MLSLIWGKKCWEICILQVLPLVSGHLSHLAHCPFPHAGLDGLDGPAARDETGLVLHWWSRLLISSYPIGNQPSRNKQLVCHMVIFKFQTPSNNMYFQFPLVGTVDQELQPVLMTAMILIQLMPSYEMLRKVLLGQMELQLRDFKVSRCIPLKWALDGITHGMLTIYQGGHNNLVNCMVFGN